MSAPEFPSGPNYPESQFPPKAGMSTGAKVLIWIGIVSAVLVVLCCGGLFVGGWYIARYVEKAASKDPAVVRQVAAQIVQMDLPPGFQPQGSLDMSFPLSIVFAVFADQSSGSTVIMAQFGEMYQQNQAQMQAQLEQQMRLQGMGHQTKAGTVKSRQEEILVRGQPVVFTFAEGKEQGTGRKRLDVMGVFPSQGKMVMLMISVDPAKYDEAQVKKMIESIR